MASKLPQIEFDLDANAAYFKISKGRISSTRKAKFESLNLLFDYDSDDNLVGIEVLNLKKVLGLYFKSQLPKIETIAESKSTHPLQMEHIVPLTLARLSSATADRVIAE